jgi:adenylate cyclase
MAIELLEQVLPHRSREQIRWFMNDSDLNPIRSHPRYQKLLEAIGDQQVT